MDVRSELPYPSLEAITPDPAALRIVAPAYAGRMGEMTAVLQYVYQSVLFGECGMKDASELLMQVSVVEMRHMHILARLITRLGAPPVFTACPPYPVGYYCAAGVNYVRGARRMICADICSEENAIAEYERMLCRLKNSDVHAVIARIIEDERVHLALFNHLLDQVCSAPA